MAHYQQAKQRIYFGVKHALYNRADALTAPLVPGNVAVTSFALDEPDLGQYGIREQEGQRFICLGFDALLDVSELALPGEHNISNAMAVLGLADAVGNKREATLAALKSFVGLPHRCEKVIERAGVAYFNDSKATNVGSTLAAVTGLGLPTKNLILLLGGQGKKQDFSPLIAACEQFCKKIICYGEDGQLLHELLSQSDLVDTMEQGLEIAKANAIGGDVVLLSPACASFDQFGNFEHRGNQFVQWVEANV
jgi:UDP-N-acetylmuramoylalanine--D-glutamate ligase